METQYPMQPYGQPALVPNRGAVPPAVVINQPVGIVNPKMFKTTPVALTCIFCNKPMTTQVTTTCNCCACILCWCTGLVFYVCVQCCRDKDICCYDAVHRCPHCSNIVGTYTAC